MSRRQLTVLTMAVFVLAGAVGQVLPLLGELEAEYDLPSVGVGLLAGTAFFASVLGQLTLAPLADRGHTDQLLVGAMVASAVGSALFVVADGMGLLVLGRFITGLGLGAFLPAARSLVAAQNPASAGQYLGRLQAVELAGFLTGPIIGAELANVYGLDAPFLASALLAAAFVPIVMTLRLPQLAASDRRQGTTRRVLPRMLRRPDVQVAVLLSIALIAPAGLYEAVWDIYLEDRGGSDRLVAFSLAVYGVLFIVMAPLGGRLADRRGAVRMGLGAGALIAPLTVVYGWITVPLVAACFVAFEAVLNGLGMPAAQSAMAKATRPGEQATGQGLAGASGEIAAGLLALVSATVYRELGAPWLFTSVAVGIALVVLAAAHRHRVAQAGAASSSRSSTTTTPSADDSVADVSLGSADTT